MVGRAIKKEYINMINNNELKNKNILSLPKMNWIAPIL